jgi:hypothetical protein
MHHLLNVRFHSAKARKPVEQATARDERPLERSSSSLVGRGVRLRPTAGGCRGDRDSPARPEPGWGRSSRSCAPTSHASGNGLPRARRGLARPSPAVALVGRANRHFV